MKARNKLAIAALGLSALGFALAACSMTPAANRETAPKEQPARAVPTSTALAPVVPGALQQPVLVEPQAAPAPAAPAPPVARPRSSLEDSSRAQKSPSEPAAYPTAIPAPMAATAPAPAPGVFYNGGGGYETESRYGDRKYPHGDYPYPTPEPYDTTFFRNYGVNPFVETRRDPLSTFAVDVDTASYTVARRFISDGFLPDPDSVRVEEFINYFEQGYESPQEEAFAIQIEGAPSPFRRGDYRLMRVGVQGREFFEEDRKDATLIFVIDTSGSMGRENRLGMVKRSLNLLVDQLRPSDEIGIVTFSTRGQVMLEPTGGQHRRVILDTIDSLTPRGSTNAEEGLTLAYDLAIARVSPDRITRVILLSDGVANVGDTRADGMLRKVRYAVEEGVTLSTIGVGMGNFNDILLERLADDGDGNYAYVDTMQEAHRIFSENLGGTLQVIARDAKIQVEFNPEVVAEYRLIGYENRDVADRDFRNDAVDAGEIGANHSVTALYEVMLHDEVLYEEAEEGVAATVFVRYEDPDTGEVVELDRDFYVGDFAPDFEAASPRFQLAAAVGEYAEILRESYWVRGSSLSQVLMVAEDAERQLSYDPEVAEFVSLVSQAKYLWHDR